MRALVIADAAWARERVLDALRSHASVSLFAATHDRRTALEYLFGGWASIVVIVHPLAGDDAFDLGRTVKTRREAPRVAICVERPDAAIAGATLVAGLDGVVDLDQPTAALLSAISDVECGRPIASEPTRAASDLDGALDTLRDQVVRR